jgi:transglutaminase-like putative cysteine protease
VFDRRRQALPQTAVARGAWGVSLALLLEVVACSIGLVGLIQGAGWWFALIGVAVLLLAVPAALRTVGVAAWVASLVDLLAFGVLVQLAFASHGALLGVVPTGDSVGRLSTLFQRALAAIQDQHVPAEPLPELIFFIVLFGGVLTIVLDLLAAVLRIPAVTAVVVGGVLVVPAVLQPSGLSLTALGAGAAAWFVLLKADGRLRLGSQGGTGVALTVGASVTVLSLVIAATAPGFIEQGRAPIASPVSIGNGVNPLIDLGADLRRPTPVDVLRYTTAAESPQYLQLTTLDDIHGTNWTHTSGNVTPLRGGTDLAEVPGLDPAFGASAQTVTSTIEVQNLRSGWLPAPYPATSVRGGFGPHAYQSDDLTIFGQGGDLSGQRYATTSLDLEPTSVQLAAEGPYDAEDFSAVRHDLSLPSRVPAVITDTANEIAAAATGSSEFDVALAIQRYFQSSLNDFTYSTDSPDTVDGASLDVIAKFLKVREGYCVHFASAMAVLARVLGIPSRIAIGYLPGTAVSQRGKQITYQVDSSDLHAWPQLYFPGVGWLNFEPTVSRGSAPSYTLTTTPDSGPTSAPQASSAPTTAPAPTASSRALPNEQAQTATNAVAARNGVPLQLAVLVLLAVLAAPGVARLLRRRGRLRRLREEGALPDVAWDEIRDTAQDLGFATSPTETPRAFAARLRADWHPDAAHQRALDEILDLVELTEFGPPRPWARYFELADKTATVVGALRASRHWTTRLIAAVAPRSLFTALAELRRAGVRTSTYD